jgi:formylglycine-generating enzyme required for sulfatase activity
MSSPFFQPGRSALLAVFLVIVTVIAIAYQLISATPRPSEDRALAGVTTNADWTPLERMFDGVMMVLVPAGCFMMGSENEFDNAQPVHEVCIETPFWLDKFEVFNADFWRLGGVREDVGVYHGEAEPVEHITWPEAEAFCRERRGGRLPTEAEWEFAARGPDGLTYPWGNEFIPQNVVYFETIDWFGYNPDLNLSKVGEGIRTAGASWVGAHDMSSNVAEWVSSRYWDYPYDPTDGREDLTATDERILRGGMFISGAEDMRGWVRYGMYPSFKLFSAGFRCARPWSTSADAR